MVSLEKIREKARKLKVKHEEELKAARAQKLADEKGEETDTTI